MLELPEDMQTHASDERHLELSRAINHLSEAILRGDTASVVLQSLVDIAGPALRVDRALIFDVQFSSQLAVGLCEWLQPDRSIAPTKAAYDLRQFEAAAHEMRRTGALESSRDDVHPLLARNGAAELLHGRMAIQRLLWYPFLHRPDGYYLLVINQVSENRPWNSDELDFVETVAAQASLALMKLNLLREREKAEAELRESENRFRLLYDQTPSMFFTVDREGVVRSLNSFAVEHLGYAASALVGQSVLKIVHPEDQNVVTGHLTACFAEPGAVRKLAFRKIHQNGSTIWVKEFARVVEGPDGASAFIVCEDVTESRANEEAARQSDERRRRAEEEVRIQRDELAHALRITTLGELTASLAHELNQPLTAVATNAHACRRMLHAGAHEDLEEILADICQDATRAGDVVHRLRTLLQKGEPERTPLDINHLVAGVATLVRHDFERARIAVRLTLGEGLPPVPGDAVQLQQVILNLLLNACDALAALPDGKRELYVVTSWGPPDSVAITVRDTGVGAPHADLTKLFEPFVTTKPQGLGLGLSISRSIVEAHAGRIWATRNEGPGLTLHVELPA
jgi:PAS domain S-box-containing protein